MNKNLFHSRTMGLTVEKTGISSLGLHKSRQRTNLNSKLTWKGMCSFRIPCLKHPLLIRLHCMRYPPATRIWHRRDACMFHCLMSDRRYTIFSHIFFRLFVYIRPCLSNYILRFFYPFKNAKSIQDVDDLDSHAF